MMAIVAAAASVCANGAFFLINWAAALVSFTLSVVLTLFLSFNVWAPLVSWLALRPGFIESVGPGLRLYLPICPWPFGKGHDWRAITVIGLVLGDPLLSLVNAALVAAPVKLSRVQIRRLQLRGLTLTIEGVRVTACVRAPGEFDAAKAAAGDAEARAARAAADADTIARRLGVLKRRPAPPGDGGGSRPPRAWWHAAVDWAVSCVRVTVTDVHVVLAPPARQHPPSAGAAGAGAAGAAVPRASLCVAVPLLSLSNGRMPRAAPLARGVFGKLLLLDGLEIRVAGVDEDAGAEEGGPAAPAYVARVGVRVDLEIPVLMDLLTAGPRCTKHVVANIAIGAGCATGGTSTRGTAAHVGHDDDGGFAARNAGGVHVRLSPDALRCIFFLTSTLAKLADATARARGKLVAAATPPSDAERRCHFAAACVAARRADLVAAGNDAAKAAAVTAAEAAVVAAWRAIPESMPSRPPLQRGNEEATPLASAMAAGKAVGARLGYRQLLRTQWAARRWAIPNLRGSDPVEVVADEAPWLFCRNSAVARNHTAPIDLRGDGGEAVARQRAALRGYQSVVDNAGVPTEARDQVDAAASAVPPPTSAPTGGGNGKGARSDGMPTKAANSGWRAMARRRGFALAYGRRLAVDAALELLLTHPAHAFCPSCVAEDDATPVRLISATVEIPRVAIDCVEENGTVLATLLVCETRVRADAALALATRTRGAEPVSPAAAATAPAAVHATVTLERLALLDRRPWSQATNVFKNVVDQGKGGIGEPLLHVSATVHGQTPWREPPAVRTSVVLSQLNLVLLLEPLEALAVWGTKLGQALDVEGGGQASRRTDDSDGAANGGGAVHTSGAGVDLPFDPDSDNEAESSDERDGEGDSDCQLCSPFEVLSVLGGGSLDAQIVLEGVSVSLGHQPEMPDGTFLTFTVSGEVVVHSCADGEAIAVELSDVAFAQSRIDPGPVRRVKIREIRQVTLDGENEQHTVRTVHAPASRGACQCVEVNLVRNRHSIIVLEGARRCILHNKIFNNPLRAVAGHRRVDVCSLPRVVASLLFLFVFYWA